MIRKLTFLAGFGAGFLAGAKAGPQGYEKAMGAVRGLGRLPGVKEAGEGLQQTASTLADRARDSVNETVSTLNDAVAPSPTLDLTARPAAPAPATPPAAAAAAGAAPPATATQGRPAADLP